MFVARLISKTDNETILDERVLDLIVERKDVNDLCSCLIQPSKSHPPLQFFEAQMYKLQHCGLENKVFLLVSSSLGDVLTWTCLLKSLDGTCLGGRRR